MTWASKCGRKGAEKFAGFCRGAGHRGNLNGQPCLTPARKEQRIAGRSVRAPEGGAGSHILLPAQGAGFEREERSHPRAGSELGEGQESAGSLPYCHLPQGGVEPCTGGRLYAQGGFATGRLCPVVEIAANGQFQGGAPGPARE